AVYRLRRLPVAVTGPPRRRRLRPRRQRLAVPRPLPRHGPLGGGGVRIDELHGELRSGEKRQRSPDSDCNLRVPPYTQRCTLPITAPRRGHHSRTDWVTKSRELNRSYTMAGNSQDAPRTVAN